MNLIPLGSKSSRLLFMLFFVQFSVVQSLFSQSVGINTDTPDPSASLEVAGTNKGLLIPRISLQSVSDNVTIPNPATALLVFNTNQALGKMGFYYNSGTAANPSWAVVGGGGDLVYPYLKTGANFGSLFHIENTNATFTSSSILGSSVSAIGVKGTTETGRGIVGSSTSTGVGVFASNTNSNGKALEVSGGLLIHGPGQNPGTGKVLSSDAQGNATWQDAIAFSVTGLKFASGYLPSSQTATKMLFESQSYNLSSAYNSESATFTSPQYGIYHFDVQITWNGTFTFGYVDLIRMRNGIRASLVRVATQGVQQISLDTKLLAGDEVFVEVFQVSGFNQMVSDDHNDTYFNGRLVIRQ